MPLFLILIFSLIFGSHSFVFCEVQPIKIEEQQQAPPCTFVIFGATGDLTARKLLPAIYHLACEGLISDNMAIVGVARCGNTHESFRNKMEKAIDEFSRIKPLNLDVWNQLRNKIFYHCCDFEDDQGYET